MTRLGRPLRGRRRGAALALAATIVVAVGAGRGAAAGATSGVTAMPEPIRPAPRAATAVDDGPLRGGAFATSTPLDVRPDGVAIESFGPTAGSEVTLTNADDWHAAGITGAGLRIGVIDFFDVTRYWNPAEMGPAPVANITARCISGGSDCTAEFFDAVDLGGENHGPAVVEIVKDMAPGAEVFIGRATTEADYRALVDWFAANGVRIISRSLGSRYDGPGDGRGVLDAVADHAVDLGITWINSGGNNAINRYYRHAVRLIGDHVAFGDAGAETWLRFNGCASPGGVRWANDWDVPPAERTDYDLIVHEAPIGFPDAGYELTRTSARQREGAPPLELILGSACPPAGRAYYLRIERVAGDPAGDVIEILDYDEGMSAHTQAAHSASTPVVDSRNAGVLAVGGVDPPASGRLGSYSSQGPTNDGRFKPDVTAPSGFANTVFGSFSGTSAAAPVVAGAGALLLQAGLAEGARELGDLLRHTVLDRGAAGSDNAFGTGELRLPAPPSVAVSQVPSAYSALASPQRVLDTRLTGPIGPPEMWGTLWPGEIVDLPVTGVAGVPASGVTAVAVNVTIAGAGRPGYGQALPTYSAAVGAFSTFNVDAAAQNRPNFAVVPVGHDGRISIYANTGGDLLVDVLGWFGPAAGSVGAGRLAPLDPAVRVLDTRRDGDRHAVTTDEVVSFAVPAVVNVTATDVVGEGFVQAFPGGRVEDIYRTSTLNLVHGATSANTVIVPATPSGVSLYTFLGPGGSAHLIADVTGYITSAATAPSTAGLFVPVRPARAFDSRNVGGPLADGEIVSVDVAAAPGVAVPSGAAGVVVNVTSTGTQRYGFVKAWPDGGGEPPTSALNWWKPGMTVANSSVIRPGGTRIATRVTDENGSTNGPLAHLIVDVFGYFTSS
jgi:Subtilase family